MLTLTDAKREECLGESLKRKHYTAARRITRVFHIRGLLSRGELLHRMLSNAIRTPLISVSIRFEA